MERTSICSIFGRLTHHTLVVLYMCFQKPETAEICRKMSVKLVVNQTSVRAARAVRAACVVIVAEVSK